MFFSRKRRPSGRFWVRKETRQHEHVSLAPDPERPSFPDRPRNNTDRRGSRNVSSRILREDIIPRQAMVEDEKKSDGSCRYEISRMRRYLPQRIEGIQQHPPRTFLKSRFVVPEDRHVAQLYPSRIASSPFAPFAPNLTDRTPTFWAPIEHLARHPPGRLPTARRPVPRPPRGPSLWSVSCGHPSLPFARICPWPAEATRYGSAAELRRRGPARRQRHVCELHALARRKSRSHEHVRAPTWIPEEGNKWTGGLARTLRTRGWTVGSETEADTSPRGWPWKHVL